MPFERRRISKMPPMDRSAVPQFATASTQVVGIFSWLWMIALLVRLVAISTTADEAQTRFTNTFEKDVRPFIQEYCIDCHGEKRPKAKFSLTPYTTLDSVIEGHQSWELVIEKLESGDMPPEEADTFPSSEQTTQVINWYRELQKHEALKHAGDPGIVLAHRLSNAEYNYAIEDLTGVAIEPTKDFPVDSANQSGFDNTGESLNISPNLLTKYLQAARNVTEHLVLKPSGLEWSPHPTVTETDRDKYAVLRIVDFYQKQPTDLADYFMAAWHHSRSASAPALSETARQHGVSARYLQTIWDLLHEPTVPVGPINKIQDRWHETLKKSAAEAERDCRNIRDYITNLRRQIEPTVKNLEGGGIHRGSQTYVLWKNDQYTANRRSYDPSSLMTAEERDRRRAENKQAIDRAKEKKSRNRPPPFQEPHPDRILPDSPKIQSLIQQSFRRFADVFPDRFYVAERGRDYLGTAREKQEKGRLLSAGFHSMMGYYRDDQPLCDLILTPEQKQELDRLWDELDYITQAPKRQFIGFLWFERTDSRYMTDPVFDFARAEYNDATEETKIKRLAKVYLEKAENNGAPTVALSAVEDYFERMNDRIRWLEYTEEQSTEKHLSDLMKFAARAYRRPLTVAEKTDLRDFYHSLRTEAKLSHDEALRETLTSVLVSPHFFYRYQQFSDSDTDQSVPLTNAELASRLSFFLWSSIPDANLRSSATQGKLSQPDEIVKQARRLIADDKIRRLAVEFGANWLDFRRFQSHNAVDRNRFPEFDNDLREAMFQEPIRFLTDLFQSDRPLSTLLYANHTFANQVLANHYNFPFPAENPDQWLRVDNAVEFGRGGILPMSVFLTQNAPGLRTSPVKRGYWVARRVLGEAIPPPPPDVPDIPSDETKMGDLTMPQILAKHREHPNCAACHERFDSLGLVFENYGPVGERRKTDLAGRPVSIAAQFPDESRGEGLSGLKSYIEREREDGFYRNFCEKLLSYALGRSLLLSDLPLIERMLANAAQSDYAFSTIVETIVTSEQFLNKRASNVLASND